MNIEWFKDPNNLAYIDGTAPMDKYAKIFRMPNLKEEIEKFRKNPIKEGITLYGEKRTSVKVFIPDLLFDEHIEMGENIFIYSGVINPCYVFYFPLDH